MGKQGKLTVALIIFVAFPLLSLIMVYAAIKDDPHFPQSFMAGGLTNMRGEDGLTNFEREHGFGPIEKEVKLSFLPDEKLAETGAKIFKMKCSACHKLGKQYVGPALRGITNFRSPTYIMNMILNPKGMTQQHPVAKGLLEQYMRDMSPQGMDETSARAVVEFLRWDFEKSQQATGAMD